MRNNIAFRVGVIVLLGSSLMGCAYVTAEPAPPGSDVRGIRVPTVKPLLVVTGAQVEVMTIPNPNREYALRFGSFLAKHKLEAEFEDAFLKTISSDQDSTAVAIEFLNTLRELGKEALPRAFSGEGGSLAGKDLQVYDIVFDEKGDLVELRPLITKTREEIEPSATPVNTGGSEERIDIQ